MKPLEITVYKCDDSELPDNIIGAAVLIEHKKPTHAGIFIRYNGDSKLFHFTGDEVLLEDFTNKELYFFKEFPFIKPVLAPSFLAHCQIVLQEAKPVFGYFYIGGLYDEQGNFRNPGDMPEYMTCVGFCLNFLKFYSEDQDIFDIGGWNISELNKTEEYVEQFIAKVKVQHPDVNIDDFKKGIRRIWPVEYFSGAYSPTLPIQRTFVDDIINEVKDKLVS